MIGFLTPFFIAFGIGAGAGVAIVLAVLAGLAVVLREMPCWAGVSRGKRPDGPAR